MPDPATRNLRSPELMSAATTGLLVVDLQEKLVPTILDHELLIWNVTRLLDAARALEMHIAATEQYPKGLGPTVESLREYFETEIPEKLTFSCSGCDGLFDRFRTEGIHRILLAGIETHICIQQTAYDLLADGFRVYLAVDAVNSRWTLDHDMALRRLEAAGVTLTTTEAAMFEWCERAGTQPFKQISSLAKEPGPVIPF